MAIFFSVHEETHADRVAIDAKWDEVSKDPRADWLLTLFNPDQRKRFCEWHAPNVEAIEQILHEFGITCLEVLEVEIAAAREWRLWGCHASKHVKNCWEVMSCNREPGGIQTVEKGVCPAASDHVNWGRNRGQFAGRICWKVEETECEGGSLGDKAGKTRNCAECEFFEQVKREEGGGFEP